MANPFNKIGKGIAGIVGGITGPLLGFGGKSPKTEQHSLYTPEQQAQLAALSGQNIDGYNQMFNQLRNLAYNPQSDYSRMANWENEFNAGVVNPALNQMNSLIADTQHSSNLHSSANRAAQDTVRQNTMDNLAGLRYNQAMAERGLEMQGLADARARQQAALTGLGNLSAQALGANSIENVVHQGKAGYLESAIPAAGAVAVGKLMSDRNVKENIEDMDIGKCTDIVKSIPLHSYNYTDEVKDYADPEVYRMGWMAQDIEKVLPEAIEKVNLDGKEILSIRPDLIYATMFGAIQQLIKDNEAMKARLETLEGGK